MKITNAVIFGASLVVWSLFMIMGLVHVIVSESALEVLKGIVYTFVALFWITFSAIMMYLSQPASTELDYLEPQYELSSRASVSATDTLQFKGRWMDEAVNQHH